MTITQLEYVVAVATFKSFVAAAEKCFVTQPTLSMQIHKLEEELNVKIFDRNKHPIALTEIGTEIVNQAKIVLSENQKIFELVNKSHGKLSGTFTMAIIPTLAPFIVPQLLDLHTKQYPDLKLIIKEMQTEEIIQKLFNYEIDGALLSTPLENNGIKEYPLFYESLVAYFGKNEKALKKRLISPMDIDLEKIWILNEGNCLRNQVLDLCSDFIKEKQKNKSYSYESSNVDTLRRMVDKNGGVTIIPEFVTQEFNDEQLEKVRYFEGDEPVREISFVTNNHFVKFSMMQAVSETILGLIPEKMRVQKKNRKVLRIQTAKF